MEIHGNFCRKKVSEFHSIERFHVTVRSIISFPINLRETRNHSNRLTDRQLPALTKKTAVCLKVLPRTRQTARQWERFAHLWAHRDCPPKGPKGFFWLQGEPAPLDIEFVLFKTVAGPTITEDLFRYQSLELAVKNHPPTTTEKY